MECTNAFEIFIFRMSWDRDMTAFGVNEPVDSFAIDHEADSNTSAHCDVSDVVNDTSMTPVFKLKLSKDIAVSVKRYPKVACQLFKI